MSGNPSLASCVRTMAKKKRQDLSYVQGALLPAPSDVYDRARPVTKARKLSIEVSLCGALVPRDECRFLKPKIS